MYRVVISIGCFTVKEVERMDLVQDKIILIFYDPHPEVCKRFKIAFKDNPNVHVIQQAVSNWNGFTDFYLAGQSSSFTKIENAEKIKIKVRTLASVVKSAEAQYGLDSPKFLFMNCEGEEVPIIQHNSIEQFCKFKKMYIEFHPKLYAEEIFQNCVDKLAESFNVMKKYGSHSKYPQFTFVLKKGR